MSLCGYVYMFTCLHLTPLPHFNVLNLYSHVFECISLVIYVDMLLCVYVVCLILPLCICLYGICYLFLDHLGLSNHILFRETGIYNTQLLCCYVPMRICSYAYTYHTFIIVFLLLRIIRRVVRDYISGLLWISHGMHVCPYSYLYICRYAGMSVCKFYPYLIRF